MASQAPRELNTVHVRHREIGDDGIQLRGCVEIGQTGRGVASDQHAGSTRFEERGQNFQGIVIVIDDQDRHALEVWQAGRWRRGHSDIGESTYGNVVVKAATRKTPWQGPDAPTWGTGRGERSIT